MAPTHAFDHETPSSYPEAEIFSAPSSAVNFGPGHLRVESQTYLGAAIQASARSCASEAAFTQPRARMRDGNLIFVDTRTI